MGRPSAVAHMGSGTGRTGVAGMAAIQIAAGAEGTVADIVAAGTARRWGLGGRREAGLRRSRRAIGDTAAWELNESVCV